MALIVQQEAHHILIRFQRPCQVLSSAILNGGLVEAQQILNLKVPQNFHGRRTDFEPPAQTLQAYADRLDLKAQTVGMMTAASLQSFRMKQSTCEDITVTALVTSGLANAKRIGEPAEWRYVDEKLPKPGTINIITVIDAALTPAAMVEAVMMATEAKAACLQAQGVQGPPSGQPATGTGTDAVAVAGNPAGRRVIYCGKHVLLGETLGRVVMGALQSSLSGWVPVESVAGPMAMDMPARLAKPLALIQANYDKPLTLEKVASAGSMSQHHFSRLFRSLMGCRFKEYLNQCRVEAAKDLLQRDGKNITEICYAVGFNDLSYFTRVFKKHAGTAPSAYRRKMRLR